MFFAYANDLLALVNKSDGKLDESNLIDMNLTEDETQRTTEYFQAQLQKRIETRSGDKSQWYGIVRGAIWATFWKELILGSFVALLAEGITISYTYSLVYLIDYLKDPDAPVSRGVWMVCLYSVAVAVSAVLRNYYIHLGAMLALRLRKCVISSMYDKVGKLSMKSLTETNSGKLVTIISGDVFNVERAICMLPILPACPLIVALCLFYIAYGSGWVNALITFAIWLLVIASQLVCNEINKHLKS